MDKTLNIILKAAGLPKVEKEELKETFYRLLALKTLIAISEVDRESFENLKSKMEKANPDMGEVASEIESIYQKDEAREKVDSAVEEVVNELVDTVTQSATQHQKHQILASLLS
jgi:predicted sugar kinase